MKLFDSSSNVINTGDLVLIAYNHYVTKGIVRGVGQANNLQYYPLTNTNESYCLSKRDPYIYWLIDQRSSEKRTLKINQDQLSPHELKIYNTIKGYLDGK